MEQLARNNLSDQIFDIIGRKIIRNQLRPGEMIYETQISKEWGVSRSPVRDALRMLEQIRLVERTPKGGYQVTELPEELIYHLYDTAIVLYQYAFAKAAENATAEDVQSLKDGLAQLEKSIAGKDFDLYLVNVTRMAYKILKMAGNPIVERIARELMPTAERVQWASITYVHDQMKTVVSHLRKGFEGIVKRDPDAAAKSFRDFATTHVEIVLASLKQSCDQSPLKKIAEKS